MCRDPVVRCVACCGDFFAIDASFCAGILLVLLSIAAYLLYQRTGAGRRSFAAALVVMAILATAQVGIHIWGTVLAFRIVRLATEGEMWPHSQRAVGLTRLFVKLFTVEDFLLVTNNMVADGLFTYRCFVIWGRNFRVVVVPMLMILATTVLGYLCAYEDDYRDTGNYVDFRLACMMSVLTNLVLMALTAGRVRWLRRDASVRADSASVGRCSSAIGIILESGAMYCISVISYVIFVSVLKPGDFSPLIDVGRGVVPQIMNIAPALIIVRVGLGYRAADVAAVPARHGPPVPAPRNAPDLGPLVIDIRASRESSMDTRGPSAESEPGKEEYVLGAL
ncbi:hypothetical protein DFH09DRAFT_379413 [Mycena vulgaris]|nr:hypothetical protein DFH09DRAFT_379413 [Mycena vulgaris]